MAFSYRNNKVLTIFQICKNLRLMSSKSIYSFQSSVVTTQSVIDTKRVSFTITLLLLLSPRLKAVIMHLIRKVSIYFGYNGHKSTTVRKNTETINKRKIISMNHCISSEKRGKDYSPFINSTKIISSQAAIKLKLKCQ